MGCAPDGEDCKASVGVLEGEGFGGGLERSDRVGVCHYRRHSHCFNIDSPVEEKVILVASWLFSCECLALMIYI